MGPSGLATSLLIFPFFSGALSERLRGSGEIAEVVDVVLVAVLDDGGLGELTIIGALILISGLTRLAKLL